MIFNLVFILLLLLAAILVIAFIWQFNKRGCVTRRLVLERNINIKPNENEIKILFLGDIGSGSEDQIRVARSSAQICERNGCDLAILLGDNFMPYGVNSVKDPQFKTKFEEVTP